MKERPIIFSGPMVRELLSGTKTQTRRVVKPQPPAWTNFALKACNGWAWIDDLTDPRHGFPDGKEAIFCPFGVPGDRLYVKEATWIWCEKRPNGTSASGRKKYRYVPVGRNVVYCADQAKPTERIDDDPTHTWRYKAARFMPRWASRIALEITGVRVQRVQEITDEDARAEGSFLDRCACMPRAKDRGIMASFTLQQCHIHGSEFRYLWDSINAKRGYGWDVNPWVFVLDFRRVA